MSTAQSVVAAALYAALPPQMAQYVLQAKLTGLLLGDHHYRSSNAPETDAFERRTHELISLYRPDFVVNLGDTLDTHDRINVRPLVRAKRFIQSIADRVPIYVLIGNHDRPNNSDFQSDLHPFGGLGAYPGVHIIDKAQSHLIMGHRFMFAPYVPPGRLAEALITTTKEGKGTMGEALAGVSALFAHQEFLGARMGAIRSTVGDPYPLTYPPCYSGHVHDYDQLQVNLCYVGAPLEHAFGAARTQGLSLVSWGLEGSHHIRIPLVIRKRLTIAATPTTLTDVKVPAQEGDLLPPAIRIVIRGTETELKGLGSNTTVRDWRRAGIKVDFKATKESGPARAAVELPADQSFLDLLTGRLTQAQQMILSGLLTA